MLDNVVVVARLFFRHNIIIINNNNNNENDNSYLKVASKYPTTPLGHCSEQKLVAD